LIYLAWVSGLQLCHLFFCSSRITALNIQVFWDVTLCRLANIYRCSKCFSIFPSIAFQTRTDRSVTAKRLKSLPATRWGPQSSQNRTWLLKFLKTLVTVKISGPAPHRYTPEKKNIVPCALRGYLLWSFSPQNIWLPFPHPTLNHI
jgi:hypothetical protein